MTSRPRRAVLIGLDGANYEAVKPLLARGLLPNLARLLHEGTRCENAYAPYPTLTGSNWASIATGAWPGTHGVTDMSYHVTGEPVDHWHSGFTSDAIEAETLWESLAHCGKKSIVLKYTGSWPPRHRDIVMVDGGGGRPFWGGSILELSHSQLFTTQAMPNASTVQTQRATGWKSLPQSAVPPLEFRIRYRPETGRIPDFLQFDGEPVRAGKPVELWGIIFGSRNAAYDTLAICTDKDMDTVWTQLGLREWSQSLELTVETPGRVQRSGVRIILNRLNPNTGRFSLYFTQLYPTDGFTQPPELGAELVEKFGAYFNHPGFSEMAMGWFGDDPETFIQLMEYQNEWLSRAAHYLMKTREWDLFAIQCHCIDFANHIFVPRHGWTQEQRDDNLLRLARCYQSVDRLIGELLVAAGDDSLVCVVSDHGATESPCPEVFINPILAEAGLLAYEESPQSHVRPKLDRSQTLAEQQRAAFIYVNLRGRDPGGIVPPEDYETVRDRIITALRNYREPTTGRNPFAMILRKEDARILGTYDNLGRDIGDIVYALLPEFDHEHGRQLPGATIGGQTMKPLLIFHGPGINAGSVLQRTAWLVDVVPTLSHAMGWPVPAEAEGAILYQLFADHKTQFPRAEFIKRQDESLRAARRRTSGTEREPATAGSRVPESKADAHVPEKEAPLPQTVEELQEALIAARAEAERWKRAYEQYHRITHGN